MTDPVDPTPIEPDPAPLPPDEAEPVVTTPGPPVNPGPPTLPPGLHLVGEHGPELIDLPATFKTVINLQRRDRRIE